MMAKVQAPDFGIISSIKSDNIIFSLMSAPLGVID